MFIVGSEAVPEAEWWAMAPPATSVHAARVSAPAPWASWNLERTDVELSDDLARGARQFASMRLSAVVVGHSSSSLLGGLGWDEAVRQRLRDILPSDVVVTTNGLDCVAAMQASALRRPLLVYPPWFGDEVLALGLRYFAEQGFDPVTQLRHDPGRKWRDLPRSELYAHGLGFEQDVEALYAQVKRACTDDADGVLLIGTGVRCVGIIDALEQDLARPVISANQASLWHCLRLAGVKASIAGYGKLLQI